MEEHDGIRLVIAGEETPWWIVLSEEARRQLTTFRDEVWKRQIREVDPSADIAFEFMVDSWPPVVNGMLRAYNQYDAIPRGPRQRPTRRKYLGEHDPNRMTIQQFWEWNGDAAKRHRTKRRTIGIQMIADPTCLHLRIYIISATKSPHRTTREHRGENGHVPTDKDMPSLIVPRRGVTIFHR